MRTAWPAALGCLAAGVSCAPMPPSAPPAQGSTPPPVVAPPAASAAPVAPAPPAPKEPDEPIPPGGKEPIGAAPAGPGKAPGPIFSCKLAAPLKSQDPCKTDADCGVSEPCHAPACVAKAKSNPPGPDTACTRNLVCTSADVNRCGCFEGRCALIPP